MGFRTVVMLSNDLLPYWRDDPQLGEKIADAAHNMNNVLSLPISDYGRVVECIHTDCGTLAMLDRHSSFTPLAYNITRHNQTTEESQIQLLKIAADAMGYRLVKKTKK